MTGRPRPRPSPLRGLKVLITAGPTREPLDPVRFISNASSGKMGHALADAARRRGARVVMVTGPTCLPPPSGVRTVPVTTAADMLAACLRHLPGAALVIGAAAVADFRPTARRAGKIKKNGDQALTLRLVPNPDILKTLAARKKKGCPVLAGFALETENLMSAARRKMRDKGLDLIVANGPEALHGDRARATILLKDGRTRPVSGPKTRVADAILKAAEEFL